MLGLQSKVKKTEVSEGKTSASQGLLVAGGLVGVAGVAAIALSPNKVGSESDSGSGQATASSAGGGGGATEGDTGSSGGESRPPAGPAGESTRACTQCFASLDPARGLFASLIMNDILTEDVLRSAPS